jgi:hypothetical protein
MATRVLRIAVIADMDGFANSAKPLLIKDVLSRRGHFVTIIDTRYLSRAAQDWPLRALPSPKPRRLLLYLIGLASRVLRYLPRRLRALFNSSLYALQLKLRGQVLVSLISNSATSSHPRTTQCRNFDIVVCESQLDSAIMLHDTPGLTKIYDCATPLADELLFGGMLTHRGYTRLRELEVEIFKRSDYLSFHWHSYADYVRKYYDYDVPNIFTFDWVANITASPPRFSYPPRIVYMGALGGYWIDLELLSQLTTRYPHIDVYGRPKPPRRLGLNYRGYAPASLLRDYQFGLITLSKDRLRREGFSAKHIDYLAAGLPVLVPEWRTSTADLGGTISYTEDNFVERVADYSSSDAWQIIADEAIKQAADYTVEKATSEFIDIVENVGDGSAFRS